MYYLYGGVALHELFVQVKINNMSIAFWHLIIFL